MCRRRMSAVAVLMSVVGCRGFGAGQSSARRPILSQRTRRAGIAVLTTSGLITGMRYVSGVGLWAARGDETQRSKTAVEMEVETTVATHPAFDLVRSEYVTEYGVTCHLYEHKKTRAQLMSVESEDENKVFGVTFRTPPRDSTGLPHILEHSVLCGSRRFPTKEPFVELLKGSMNTFLNAFTYPDRTCYPVASQNLEDFRNLARVYLDAVFHPRAIEDPYVLKQEGWHYELDESDVLTYKGVVYNEMKGVYSSPDALMGRAARMALFPDNTYAVDSGGDPKVIPELTFGQFKDFHEEFYSPANSRLYFYGNDDPQERLELLDEYLSQFNVTTKSRSATEVKEQRLSFSEPRKVQAHFPVSGQKEELHMVSLNWLLALDELSAVDELGLAVLDHLMLGTASAALRKTLSESGLGESVMGQGLSDELRQPTFSVGFKGVSPENVEKVEKLIMDRLGELVVSGFDGEAIAASMNTVEFGLREFNTGSFPRGLSLMLGSMRKWVYERDPIAAIRFEAPLADLKATLKRDEQYFQSLLRTLLAENKHRVTVEMVPDAFLEEQNSNEEKDRLASLKAAMSSADLSAVRDEMDVLREKQETADTPEALATIPRLQISDLERNIRSIECRESSSGSIVLLERTLPTASIIYVDVALDLGGRLDAEDVGLVPLMARMFLDSGIQGKSDRTQLQRRIGTSTGGISFSTINTLQRGGDTVPSPDALVWRLVLRGKATSANAGNLFELIEDVLWSADFAGNQRRVVEMLKETKQRYEAAFRTQGQRLAATTLASQHSLSGHVAEHTNGLSHYATSLKLLQMAQDDYPRLLARLERMRSSLLDSDATTVINLTGDDTALEAAKAHLPRLQTRFLQSPSSETPAPWTIKEESNEDRGYAVPTQVNYVAVGGRMYDVGERPSGADSVVRRFLSLDYLWNSVRVKGGAYGASCTLAPRTGVLTFSSYRDPNLVSTLKTFEAAADWLFQEVDLDEAELTKAVVASIGQLDSPLNPDQKGMASLTRWLDGTTDELRQQWRDEVINTDMSDFKNFAARLRKLKSKAAVFASAAALQEANDLLPDDDQISVTKLL